MKSKFNAMACAFGKQVYTKVHTRLYNVQGFELASLVMVCRAS